MDIALPYDFELRSYQQPLWDAIVVRNMLRAITIWPRRNGKDLTAVNVLTAKATQRVGLYLYVAPFQTQVRQIIWQGKDGSGKRFLDYIPPALTTRARDSLMEIDLINGSVIKLIGSDNIDAIVGTNPVGIIYTEFSIQKPEAWGYMRPILAENGGWAIFNGTPRGMNHFYRMAKEAQKNKNWFYQYLTRDDTGVPTLEAIEEDRRSGMPESLIKQEYYCSWSASSEDVFIPLDLIQPTISLPLQPHEYNFKPRIIGVDVAYAANGDSATIACRQGRKLHPIDEFQGMDNMAFASEVARKIREFNPHAVFVDAGRGEGVISRLWQLGFDDVVIPVHFGGKTYDELYSNMKAKMWAATRSWFLEENKPSIPDDETLVAELSAPFFDMDEKNRLVIESKKAMKSRGLASPNKADSLILTFADDVEALVDLTPRERQLGITQRHLDDLRSDVSNEPYENYDPLSYMDKLMGGQ